MDDAGNTYALLFNNGIGESGINLRKFGADGRFEWRFNLPFDRAAISSLAPVVAPGGEVFIAGRAYLTETAFGRVDGNFLARLNPADGTVLWVKNLNTSAKFDTSFIRLLDLDGTGHVPLLVADNLGGNRSVRSFAYDGTETLPTALSFLPAVLDTKNAAYAFDRAGGFYSYANRFEALNLGPTNLAALGNNGARSFVLALYDATGAFQWSRTFGNLGVSPVDPLRLLVDRDDNAVVAGGFGGGTFGTNQLQGSSYAAKVTPAGAVAWAKGWWLQVADAALGTDGSVYLTGSFRFAPAPNGGVTRQVPFGTTYVAGVSVRSEDQFVAKLGADGREQFIRQTGGPEFATDTSLAYRLAVDSRGGVTTGGFTRVAETGGGLDFGDLRFVWPDLRPFLGGSSGGDLSCYYIARLEADVAPSAPAEVTFRPPAPGSTTLRLDWPAGSKLQRRSDLHSSAWETLLVTPPYDVDLLRSVEGYFRVGP